jgi:hypothetical protein
VHIVLSTYGIKAGNLKTSHNVMLNVSDKFSHIDERIKHLKEECMAELIAQGFVW